MGRNLSRRTAVVFGLFAIILVGLLVYAVGRYTNARKASVETHHKKQLILAVDGFSWDAFQEAQRRGLFKRFKYSAKHVAPYPSMSHPSWTEIIGTRRVFGER